MTFGSARTSTVFASLADLPGERVSVGAIIARLGERTFALLVVVLGLPNCLPMPPPIPLVSGFLLLFVAFQIVVGMRTPWLPRRLLGKTISRAVLERAVSRALPWLRRLERIAEPRLAFFETDLGLRLIGVVTLLFALGLIFAAPFVGQVPMGLAACLVGLGLVERDGFVVIGGFVLGTVGIGLTLGFVFAIASSAAAIF
jgi:hypothetical protein